MTNKRQSKKEAEYTVRARCDKALKERVVIAAVRAGLTEQEFILMAVQDALKEAKQ